jgi:hypothetical protein
MRSIEIKNIGLPNKSSVYIKQRQYAIFLGNDAKRYFTDMKDAKRFLAETNRFLNERLHEINYLYGNIFVEYRKIWFYFDDKQKNEYRIAEAFENADKFFHRAATKSHTINGNVFTFNYVFGVCNELQDAIKWIAEIMRKRNLFADIRRLMTFDRQLKQIVHEILSYGKY